MKTCHIYAFTETGVIQNLRLAAQLRQAGWDVSSYGPDRFPALYPMVPDLHGATKKSFADAEIIIYIGATAIAVRAIAPFLAGKDVDPAVLVVDEKGTYVIPILSGHLGGGNAAARTIAAYLGATPVITTATDINDAFAVDTWAQATGLHVSTVNHIKDISGAILEGKNVGLYSQFLVEGTLPANIVMAESGDLGIAISLYGAIKPFTKTLVLQPKVLHVGVGCRQGVSTEALDDLLKKVLHTQGLSRQQIVSVASIDRKQEEPAIVNLASALKVPFNTYDAETLKDVEGIFQSSEFVEETVGVDNVCERAAIADCPDGQLIVKKTKGEGITIAVAAEPYTVKF